MNRGRSSFVVLAAVLAIACDPVDEGPPPATPGTELAPVSPPEAPAAAPEHGDDPDAKYASGEYAIGADSDAYDDDDPTALTDFRQTLDAHGTWTDDPTFGTVWSPAPGEVGRDFAPYATGGHWVYDTDYVWVSDYDWGWAPFHYGRWVFIEGRGWAWIPGREYGGAWVGWGVDDGFGFVGWYPLAPAYLWFGGVGVAVGFPVGSRWNYCPHGDVFLPALGSHLVRGPAAAKLAGRVHTLPAAGGGVARGPDPARLGFNAARIPHASGSAAAELAKAQQFSRPSTAVALGARPVTRRSTAAAFATGSRPSLTGRSAATPTSTAHPVTSGVAPAGQAVRLKPATQSAPMFRSSPEVHMGGGHHR